MTHIVSNHEMNRRTKIAYAQSEITKAMARCAELSPIEWLRVLNESSARMISHGLKQEWQEEEN